MLDLAGHCWTFRGIPGRNRGHLSNGKLKGIVWAYDCAASRPHNNCSILDYGICVVGKWDGLPFLKRAHTVPLTLAYKSHISYFNCTNAGTIFSHLFWYIGYFLIFLVSSDQWQEACVELSDARSPHIYIYRYFLKTWQIEVVFK